MRKYLTYRNDTGWGPSHGHRQHAQKSLKIVRFVPEIS